MDFTNPGNGRTSFAFIGILRSTVHWDEEFEMIKIIEMTIWFTVYRNEVTNLTAQTRLSLWL